MRLHRKTYRNKAGRSFSEGRKFDFSDFYDYYNTLDDTEWEIAIQNAAKKNVDISNIRSYMRVYQRPDFDPMGFEEVCDKLEQMHNPGIRYECPSAILSREEKRLEVEKLYNSLGIPVPDYWKKNYTNMSHIRSGRRYDIISDIFLGFRTMPRISTMKGNC